MTKLERDVIEAAIARCKEWQRKCPQTWKLVRAGTSDLSPKALALIHATVKLIAARKR